MKSTLLSQAKSPIAKTSCSYSQVNVQTDVVPSLNYTASSILGNSLFLGGAQPNYSWVVFARSLLSSQNWSTSESYLYTPASGNPLSGGQLSSLFSLSTNQLFVVGYATEGSTIHTLIQKSSNGGNTYSLVADIPGVSPLGQITSDGNGGLYLKLSANTQILRSLDNGNTWSIITTTALPQDITTYSVLSASKINGSLYQTLDSDTQITIRKSTDKGLNWTNVSTLNFSAIDNNAARMSPQSFALGMSHKIFEDHVGGLYLAATVYEGQVLIGGQLVTQSNSYLLKSVDQGKNWSVVYNAKNNSIIPFQALSTSFQLLDENQSDQKLIQVQLSGLSGGQLTTGWELATSSDGNTWSVRVSGNNSLVYGSSNIDSQGNLWFLRYSVTNTRELTKLECTPVQSPSPSPSPIPSPSPSASAKPIRYGDPNGNCLNLNTWITNVKPVAVNNCVNCHGSVNSGAYSAFPMNVNNNAAMCKEFLLSGETSNGNTRMSVLIFYPFSDFHPVKFGSNVQMQVDPAWVNWVDSEKN